MRYLVGLVLGAIGGVVVSMLFTPSIAASQLIVFVCAVVGAACAAKPAKKRGEADGGGE